MTRTRVLTLVLVLLVGGVVGYWIWPWAGPLTIARDKLSP